MTTMLQGVSYLPSLALTYELECGEHVKSSRLQLPTSTPYITTWVHNIHLPRLLFPPPPLYFLPYAAV